MISEDLYYPDIYYRIHPHVQQVCKQWQSAKAPINKNTIGAMVDHVCALALQADPSLHDYMVGSAEVYAAQPFGGIFGDLVSIILIGELFRNRRRPQHRPRRFY